MVELIVTVSILGILVAMGLPELAKLRDRSAVRSAKQQVGAYLAIARAAAIRRGGTAQFHAADNRIWVTSAGNGTASDTVGPAIPMHAEFSVVLAATADSIVFDARGVATNLMGTQTFRVARAGYSDSVCVSRGGMIGPRCGF